MLNLKKKIDKNYEFCLLYNETWKKNSIQNESTEMTSTCEEEIHQIKAEGDLNINSVRMATTDNQKCCDFEAISKQLDKERAKNVTLKQEIIDLKDIIKRRNDLIFEQQLFIEVLDQVIDEKDEVSPSMSEKLSAEITTSEKFVVGIEQQKTE